MLSKLSKPLSQGSRSNILPESAELANRVRDVWRLAAAEISSPAIRRQTRSQVYSDIIGPETQCQQRDRVKYEQLKPRLTTLLFKHVLISTKEQATYIQGCHIGNSLLPHQTSDAPDICRLRPGIGEWCVGTIVDIDLDGRLCLSPAPGSVGAKHDAHLVTQVLETPSLSESGAQAVPDLRYNLTFLAEPSQRKAASVWRELAQCT